MRRAAFILLSAIGGIPLQAAAFQDNAVQILTEELKAHTPAKWEVRVRWRDGQLLASITPWPYQDAFQLWYDAAKLLDTLTGLCPKPDQEIWKLIKPEQDVILEPTVGGKSGNQLPQGQRVIAAFFSSAGGAFSWVGHFLSRPLEKSARFFRP